jgi:hypothetical protein
MADAPDEHDDRYGRLLREHTEATALMHAAIHADPDRARGYQHAEEMRAWHQTRVGEYADLKGDVLLAAAEERHMGPSELGELAGGVKRQLTYRMVKEARARRGDTGHGEETG